MSKDLFIQMREEETSTSKQSNPMKKSIYNIQQEHLRLMAQIEDMEGEITPDVADSLNLTKEDFESKAVSYGYVIKQLDDDIEQLKTEIKRLTDIKDKKEILKELLKSRISNAMNLFSVEKIDKNNLKLSFRKSEQLFIQEDATIPLDFINTKEVETVDKAGLKAAIKAGQEFDGIWIEENKNLQYK